MLVTGGSEGTWPISPGTWMNDRAVEPAIVDQDRGDELLAMRAALDTNRYVRV
jgi:hypothetical protein